MNFLIQLLKGFIRSGVNQVGRDGGKVVSNKVYGDKHSTPIKVLKQYEIDRKRFLIKTIGESLGLDETILSNSIVVGSFKHEIKLNTETFNLKKFKDDCQELYQLLLDENESKFLNNFYISVSKTIKNEKLKLKYQNQLTDFEIEKLINGQYFIGMTEDMLLDSIGQPDRLEEEVLKTKTTSIKGERALVFKEKELTVQGIPVKFYRNNYINSFSEFWKIEALFKKDEVKFVLNSFGGEISDASIERLFEKPSIQFYTDKNEKTLFSYTSSNFTKKYGELIPVNALTALKEYGIDKLEKASEKGYTRI